jgi:hypothetical protein
MAWQDISWGGPSRSDIPAALGVQVDDRKASGQSRQREEGHHDDQHPEQTNLLQGDLGMDGHPSGKDARVVPTSGAPENDIVLDTPYLEDAAKNGISLWGRNRGVTQPNAETPPSPNL